MHIEFWFENLNTRHHMGILGTDGRTMRDDCMK
jgi:hypothetical protein